jgi:uncharacterized membrane protein
VINVLRSETVKVDISIDQALRFIITAGVLTPEHVDASDVERPGERLLSAHEAAERALADETARRGQDEEKDAGGDG